MPPRKHTRRSRRERAAGSAAPRPRPPAPAPGEAAAAPARGRTRRALATAGVVGLGAVLLAGGAVVALRGFGGGSAPSCDPDPAGWNAQGGGPLHHSAVAAAAPVPPAGWHPLWSYPGAGAGGDRQVTAPPSAASGALYTARRDGTLVVLDAATGAERWSSAPPDGATGEARVAVALDGCAAVVATSARDAAGNPTGAVRAVDLAGHQSRWTVPLQDFAFSAPVVVDGVDYQGMAVAHPGGAPLDRDHVLDGYYLADGSRGYRKALRAAMLASPASDGSHIWAATLDDSVYGLGPGGRQLWSFTTGGPITVDPVEGGGVLYVASADGRLYALDGATGSERWEAALGAPATMPPLLAGGTVVAGGAGGTLHAYDAAGGAPRWTHRTPAPLGHGMAAAGSLLFAADDAGTVHALDLASGDERATWTAPAPPVGPPALYAGRLYLTCADGRLYALPD